MEGGDAHNQISGGVFFGPVSQGQNVTVQLPAPVTPALSGLPARSPGFTGRDELLNSLLAELAPASSTPGPRAVACSIAGMAGVGKTELAVQVAHSAIGQGWFPGGVLFVDLYGYDQARRLEPGAALDGLLRALGMPAEHIPPKTQDRSRLFTSILATFAAQERRILVVLDNAFCAEQVRPLLPTDEVTGAVITSRHTLAILNARLVELAVLAAEDSVNVLERAVRTARGAEDPRFIAERAEAEEVAKWCGYLPLALRIVAALLGEDQARPLAAMAADLAHEHDRLDQLQYEEVAVRAAIELSCRHLDREQARVFRLLPVNPGPDVATDAAAALAGGQERAVRRVLESLARAHLIERGAERWRMHDLIRVYASELTTADDGPAHEAAFDRLVDHYLGAARDGDAHMLALPGEQVARRRFRAAADADALAWFDQERLNLVATVTTAAATPAIEFHRAIAVPLLAIRLDSYLRRRRRFDELITVAQAALPVARQTGDRHSEGWLLNSLGLALWELRRCDEAIAVHQEAAEIHHRADDRPGGRLSTTGAVRWARQYGEATTLTNLGLALKDAGRLSEAADKHQQAVAIYEEIGDRHHAGLAMGNLGIVMRDAGLPDEAMELLGLDLAICREFGDRHNEAAAVNSIGTVLLVTGRFDEAIAAHQQAAEIYRETGDQHHEGAALNNLGLALEMVRRFDEAIAAHQRAAEIYREIGEPHYESKSLENLAEAREKAGTARLESQDPARSRILRRRGGPRCPGPVRRTPRWFRK